MFVSQMGYVLVVMKESRSRIVEHNPLVRTILEEFKDVIPNEIPTGLPPMREVQHCIDLVPGSVYLIRQPILACVVSLSTTSRNARGFEVFWERIGGGNSSSGCKENV
ncbi:hypothetical protein Tco_0684789 [Tanacetum coccineum]